MRGVLLARTHFEVLGFDGWSLRPQDLGDDEVRKAYKRCTRAVDASRDLGKDVALCRVDAAYRALANAEMRERTWRATATPVAVRGPVSVPNDGATDTKEGTNKDDTRLLGRLRTTKNPAGGARLPWTVDHAIEGSVAAGPMNGNELVAALRRKPGGGRDFFIIPSQMAGSASNSSSEQVASLRDEITFAVREPGFPCTSPKLARFWVAGEGPGDFVLRYWFCETRKTNAKTQPPLVAGGEWKLQRGDVRRLVLMKPSGRLNTHTSLKLIAVEHQQHGGTNGWILSAVDETDDVLGWVTKMRTLLPNYGNDKNDESNPPNTPPPLERGRGNMRGTAPSPVRRHLVPT